MNTKETTFWNKEMNSSLSVDRKSNLIWPLRKKCLYSEFFLIRIFFSSFGLNMEIYKVDSCIQFKCREIQTKKTPNANTFLPVDVRTFLWYVNLKYWKHFIGNLQLQLSEWLWRHETISSNSCCFASLTPECVYTHTYIIHMYVYLLYIDHFRIEI